MPMRPCLVCGTPSDRPRCPAHDTWNSRTPSSSRGYGGDWPRISRAVIAEVGHCEECGTISDLTTDHIVPIREGGTNERTNLRCLCRGCNTSRAVRASNERRRAIA